MICQCVRRYLNCVVGLQGSCATLLFYRPHVAFRPLHLCDSQPRLDQVAALALGPGHVATAICAARLGTFDRSQDSAGEQGNGEQRLVRGEGPVSMECSRSAAGACSSARPAPAAAQAGQQGAASGDSSASMESHRSAAGAPGSAASSAPMDAQPSPQATQRSGHGGARQGFGDPLVECVVVASHRMPETAGSKGEGFLTVLQLRAGPPGGPAELAVLDTLHLAFSCTSLAAMPDAPAQPGQRGGPLRGGGACSAGRMRPGSICECIGGWDLPGQAAGQVLLLGCADGEVHLVRLAVDGARAARPGLPRHADAGNASALSSSGAGLAGASGTRPQPWQEGDGGAMASASGSRSQPGRAHGSGVANTRSSQPQPGPLGGPALNGLPAGPAAADPESLRDIGDHQPMRMRWPGETLEREGLAAENAAAGIAPWAAPPGGGPPPGAAAAAGAAAQRAPGAEEQEGGAGPAAARQPAQWPEGAAHAFDGLRQAVEQACRIVQRDITLGDVERMSSEHASREAIVAGIESCARCDRQRRVVREHRLATAELPAHGCVLALDAQVPHARASPSCRVHLDRELHRLCQCRRVKLSGARLHHGADAHKQARKPRLVRIIGNVR